MPYRSYGTYSHLYIKGRALDNEPLQIVQDQSIFRTIKNTYKQFDSFEIPDAKIELRIKDQIDILTKTNDEGPVDDNDLAHPQRHSTAPVQLQLDEEKNIQDTRSVCHGQREARGRRPPGAHCTARRGAHHCIGRLVLA